MSTLTATDVSVQISGKQLLDAVSLRVSEGGWLAIVGPNGAGKSTLLRALGGLIGHTGCVRVGTQALSAMPVRQRSRQIAYLPQIPRLRADMTVAEYVALGRTPHLSYFGRESRGDRAIIAEALTARKLHAHLSKALQLRIDGSFREPEARDAIPQHASAFILFLKNSDAIPGFTHIIRVRQAGRAASDYGDALSVRRGAYVARFIAASFRRF